MVNKSGLDLNFLGHLSRRPSEIENLPVLHEITPVRAIIYVIIFLIIHLSCRTSVTIIQPVQGAIFQNFYLSRTVGQSLRSSPASNHKYMYVYCHITDNSVFIYGVGMGLEVFINFTVNTYSGWVIKILND